ncbi:hypothetical protein CFOL_v3_04512, partial [Cephalotus follicularis]
ILLLLKSTNMGFLVYKGFILVVCIGVLALQVDKVSSLRSIDHALKWHKGTLPFDRSLHITRAVAVEDLQKMSNSAPSPSIMFDPNQSNKRSVPKGSDPIHNRC